MLPVLELELRAVKSQATRSPLVASSRRAQAKSSKPLPSVDTYWKCRLRLWPAAALNRPETIFEPLVSVPVLLPSSCSGDTPRAAESAVVRTP